MGGVEAGWGKKVEGEVGRVMQVLDEVTQLSEELEKEDEEA